MRWLLPFLSLTLAGCLNPYAGDFKCPKTDPGRCVSVQDAYEEARDPAAGDAGAPGAGRDLYRDALYDRFAGLLREPETPIVVPPKVMRVLLFPYEGSENELYMLRYAYIFVDEPRWILGDQTRLREGE